MCGVEHTDATHAAIVVVVVVVVARVTFAHAHAQSASPIKKTFLWRSMRIDN